MNLEQKNLERAERRSRLMIKLDEVFSRVKMKPPKQSLIIKILVLIQKLRDWWYRRKNG